MESMADGRADRARSISKRRRRAAQPVSGTAYKNMSVDELREKIQIVYFPESVDDGVVPEDIFVNFDIQ